MLWKSGARDVFCGKLALFVGIAVQRNGAQQDFSLHDLHDAVGRIARVADAAGVKHGDAVARFGKDPVGMAEKDDIGFLLLSGVHNAQQRLLHVAGVPVADQNALVLQTQDLLRLVEGAEIAIARHLREGDLRKHRVQLFAVAHHVAQMDDLVRHGAGNGLRHIVHIAVGIGKDQDFHCSASFLAGGAGRRAGWDFLLL